VRSLHLLIRGANDERNHVSISRSVTLSPRYGHVTRDFAAPPLPSVYHPQKISPPHHPRSVWRPYPPPVAPQRGSGLETVSPAGIAMWRLGKSRVGEAVKTACCAVGVTNPCPGDLACSACGLKLFARRSGRWVVQPQPSGCGGKVTSQAQNIAARGQP
jgi:hypothetical protein